MSERHRRSWGSSFKTVTTSHFIPITYSWLPCILVFYIPFVFLCFLSLLAQAKSSARTEKSSRRSWTSRVSCASGSRGTTTKSLPGMRQAGRRLSGRKLPVEKRWMDRSTEFPVRYNLSTPLPLSHPPLSGKQGVVPRCAACCDAVPSCCFISCFVTSAIVFIASSTHSPLPHCNVGCVWALWWGRYSMFLL